MRVRLLRRRVVAGLALGLSVLVGFGMPLGDVATASAFAAPLSGTENADPNIAEGDNAKPEADNESIVDSAEQDDVQKSGDQQDEQTQPDEMQMLNNDDEPIMQLREVPGEDGETYHMPDAGRPYVAFEVKDTTGQHVGGSTVNFQGPRTGTGAWQNPVNWGSSTAVLDCTTGGSACATTSLDQDSRPGYFAIDRISGGANPTYVQSTSRYRVGASGTAPSGFMWTTSPLTATNETTATMESVTGYTLGTNNSPQNGQWINNGTNTVNAINGPTLQGHAPVCEVGYIYALGGSGQMQQIVQTSNTAGTISNIGSAASGVSAFNGLGIGFKNGNQVVYAFNRTGSGNNQGAVIYTYNTTTGTWSNTGPTIAADSSSMLGGAVAPDGSYWLGGFTSSGLFKLWRVENGVATQKGNIDAGASGNGDIAFDSLGNLYLVWNQSSSSSNTRIYRVDKTNLPSGSSTATLTSTNILPTTSIASGTNGAAYDGSGKLFVGAASSIRWVSLPSPSTATQLTLTGGTMNSSDLASCSYPPTITVQKNLPGGRSVPTDEFELNLKYGATNLGSATAKTPASGVQDQKVGPIPVSLGETFTFTETFTNGANAANYDTTWECSIDDEVMTGVTGSGTNGSITVPVSAAGEDIVCTFTNAEKTARLVPTKSADPASGTLVDENQIVTYTLKFDNTAGTAPATIDHRDWLKDVLDDAFFINASGDPVATPVIVSSTGLTAEWKNDDPANPRIDITGTVAAGASSTVTFKVKVKGNSADLNDRQSSQAPLQGYLMRNYLTPGSVETPPTTCDDTTNLCTEHPISAWTFEKTSLPADGASLHKGGNAHYRLAATKMNSSADLQTVTFTDDLTHVFKTAGWAPNAAVPGGALPRGIYLFDKDNKTLDQAGGLTATQPAPAYDASQVGPPTQDGSGNWILTNTVTMPTNAMRAELWFAVQAGETPVGVPATLGLPNNQPPPAMIDPASGWVFVNYATASGTKSGEEPFVANQCDTTTGGEAGWWLADTAIDPRNGASAADPDVPETCQVMHKLSANYFTIRKDAAGAGENLPVLPAYGSDTTGLWNMIGHEFEIRDDNNGAPSTHQSKYLCRTEYNPGTPGGTSAWSGNFITGGTLDSGLGSPTLAAIKAWNNAQADTDDHLPECAIAYPQQNAGGQTGRWKVENLPEQGAFTATPDQATGQYWLIETKAPNKQISLNGELRRDVPGVQRLAEPMPFKVWPLTDGTNWPSIDGQSQDEQARTGRGQLDVSLSGSFGSGPPATGEYVERCLPGGNVGSRPTACVNPTGYLMIVKDPVPKALPLTGGVWLGVVTTGGLVLLAGAAVGAAVWRRKQTTKISVDQG